jgi:hypothetical protein
MLRSDIDRNKRRLFSDDDMVPKQMRVEECVWFQIANQNM